MRQFHGILISIALIAMLALAIVAILKFQAMPAGDGGPNTPDQSLSGPPAAGIDVDLLDKAKATADLDRTESTPEATTALVDCCVVSDDGRPLADVTVSVHSLGSHTEPYRTTSDTEGKAVLLLTTESPSLLIGSLLVPNGHRTGSLLIYPDELPRPLRLTIRFTLGASIVGLVVRNQSPVSGITVRCLDGLEPLAAECDESGIFQFHNLLPRQYWIRVGSNESLQFQQVEYLQEGECRFLRIELGTADVVVNVRDPERLFADLSNAVVRLTSLDLSLAAPLRLIQIGADGAAKFENVTVGHYQVEVLPRNVSFLDPGVTFAPVSERLRVVEGSNACHIRLAQSPVLELAVFNEDGSTAPPSRLSFSTPSSGTLQPFDQYTLTKREAPTLIRAPIGESTLYVHHSVFGLATVHLNLLPGERQACSLTLGRTTNSLTIISDEDIEAEGLIINVHSEDGGLFTSRTVYREPPPQSLGENEPFLSEKGAQAQAQFQTARFDNMPAGNYSVTISTQSRRLSLYTVSVVGPVILDLSRDY